VVGHGHFGETWGIKRGMLMGRPGYPEVWEQLDDVIDHVYRFADGYGLRISLTFVDEGGLNTQDVRMACRERMGKKVFAIKGLGGSDIPYTAPPKKMQIMVSGKAVGTCWQYQLGVDAGKQAIMDSLRVKQPGTKYSHFPRNEGAGYDAAFFRGLLSERLVYKKGRKKPWVWEKIPGHERNEPLDCRNYANAAFKSLAPDLDAVEKRMRAARSGRSTNTMQPARKPTTRKLTSKDVNKYYDDW